MQFGAEFQVLNCVHMTMWVSQQHSKMHLAKKTHFKKLEIRSVKLGICPIAMSTMNGMFL